MKKWQNSLISSTKSGTKKKATEKRLRIKNIFWWPPWTNFTSALQSYSILVFKDSKTQVRMTVTSTPNATKLKVPLKRSQHKRKILRKSSNFSSKIKPKTNVKTWVSTRSPIIRFWKKIITSSICCSQTIKWTNAYFSLDRKTRLENSTQLLRILISKPAI